MSYNLIKSVVNVPKQGKDHHLEMVNWCREHLGIGNFQWFGYEIGAVNSSLFHFYSDEGATAFVLRWGGKSKIRTHDKD